MAHPDLAIATDNGASIMLGNGDGTFKSPISYAIGSSGNGIITADFNGDGNLDLALVPNNTNVVVLLGNGDGTFQAAIATSILGASLAASDFNGDGKLDLAAVDLFTQDALLALGNGDGTFQASVAYLVVPGIGSALTVGDFNADGVPDWAVAGSDPGTLSVMLSTPFKSISPGSLNFGSQGVGTTSLPQTITLSNPSNVMFSLSSIASSGNFAQTNTCGASLTVGASCVNVTFTAQPPPAARDGPQASGSPVASLSVSDSATGSPQSATLVGTGLGAAVTLAPNLLTFSSQVVGTTSAAQVVTLTNTGQAPRCW
jgi:hypothetical protein